MRPQSHGRAVRAVTALGAVVITAGGVRQRCSRRPAAQHPPRADRHRATIPVGASAGMSAGSTPVRMNARMLHRDVLVGRRRRVHRLDRARHRGAPRRRPTAPGRSLGRRRARQDRRPRQLPRPRLPAAAWPCAPARARSPERTARRGRRRSATVYRAVFASWYGPGGTTACGQSLGAATLGVANRTLPCGTLVTLRYRGRTVRVPVIDRGPFVAGRDYDLTYATKSLPRHGRRIADLGQRLIDPPVAGCAPLRAAARAAPGRSAPARCGSRSSKDGTRTPSRRTGRGGA